TAQPALRIEQRDADALLEQRLEESGIHFLGAEGIEQHRYFDTARAGPEQRGAQSRRRTFLPQQIGLETNGTGCGVDAPLHLVVGLVDGSQPARRMRAVPVLSVDGHSSEAERNSTPSERSLRYRCVRSMPTR